MTATRPPAAGPLRIDVFSIFPELVTGYCQASILGRAQRGGHLELRVHDLRKGATDAHRSVDDAPFGGGAGMVLSAEPIFSVVERARPAGPLLCLSPGGRRFDQDLAGELATAPVGFSLLCGRYEGIDQRVVEHLVDEEISIGDYVLAGGELGALVVIEAVARLVPGVLGNEASVAEESFAGGLLEYPQYTRPAIFRGWPVPEVLLAGDHREVARFRLASALAHTLARRPDLVAARGGVSEDEVALLERYGYAQAAAQAAGSGLVRAAAGGDVRIEKRSET